MDNKGAHLRTVGVVIVTYNGSQWIKKCLDSLIGINGLKKIIVIDNNSNDKTKLIIKESYNLKNLEFIEMTENLGFGKANNIGIEKLLLEGIDFIYLINQDVYLTDNDFSEYIEILEGNTKIGVVCPVQMDGIGNEVDMKFQQYLTPNNTPHFLSDLYKGALRKYYITEFTNAAAWFVRASMFKRIGCFDEKFEHYGEDNDFCIRLHNAGMLMVLAPHLRVFHDRAQTLSKSERHRKNLPVINAILYLKKNKSISKLRLARLYIAYCLLNFMAFNGKNDSISLEASKYKNALRFK